MSISITSKKDKPFIESGSKVQSTANQIELSTQQPSRYVSGPVSDMRDLAPQLLAAIDAVIKSALEEDLGIENADFTSAISRNEIMERDVTSAGTIPITQQAQGEFVVKGHGVIAGLPIAERVFNLLDPDATFEVLIPEGTLITSHPKTVARVKGSARALLIAERTALNIMQRLSGIATVTRKYADKVNPHGIKILDTRKTTPGLRALEKYAVVAGGGTNHRIGLYDAILIKDNHIAVAGGVTEAVNAARSKAPHLKLEVEVTNQVQLQQALDAKADKVLLDNMSPAQVQESVNLVAGRAFIEVSGGINYESIDRYLIKGVDAISVGALTHSVISLDISLEIEG